MRLPDVATLSKTISLQRSPTNETKDTAKTLEKHLDEMIETGKEEKSQKQPEKRSKSWTSMIMRNRFEVCLAMSVLFGLIIVLSGLLAASRRGSDKAGTASINAPKENSGDFWYTIPSRPGSSQGSGVASPPVTTPTFTSGSPISPTQPPSKAPRAATIGPALPTIDDQLSEVIPMSELRDRGTPLGRAYRWIAQQDDIRSIVDYPTVVQRFTLAAFYFATGGGRTQATWNACSAVPTDVVADRDALSTRCVIGEGDEDEEVICAEHSAFLECPEYYEGLAAPANPKRRWLSEVSECNWYGVYCNPNGIVEEISLADNGLEGVLLTELDLLTELKSLDLNGNDLSGTLPKWRKWKHMEHVLLSGLALEGSIPDTWTTWSELETLELANNGLIGTLILPGEWTNLYKLDVRNNNFDIGLRPTIGEAVRMEMLKVAGNNVGNILPDSIANLESLRNLDLSAAGMMGTIPETIGTLTNLGKLISYNCICVLCTAFSLLGILHSCAEELDLHENSFTGTIPDGIYGLTSLRILRLGRNALSGSLSEEVGNLQALVSLAVDGLGLNGEIPESISNLPDLEELQLQLNEFDSDVPEDICDNSWLVDLRADCDGPGSIKCDCCTQCCDARRGKCKEE